MEIERVSMGFREKVAWLSLAAMAVTYGPYFAMSAGASHEALPNLRQLELFASTALAQMVILGAGHLVLGLRASRAERAIVDERDRAIAHRSMTSAYYVLIAGMILVGCIMPFSVGGWEIVNAALFMIILAEVVHYGVVVFSYRRQA